MDTPFPDHSLDTRANRRHGGCTTTWDVSGRLVERCRAARGGVAGGGLTPRQAEVDVVEALEAREVIILDLDGRRWLEAAGVEDAKAVRRRGGHRFS
jgi:hypothetical protein